jgi:hypothetical protein
VGKLAVPSLAAVLPTGIAEPGGKANFLISGTFTAVGPSAPFYAYGPFNVVIWGSVNTTLTTTAGSNAASVVSGTGIVIGQAINSPLGNVPPGTTWLTFSGTTGTLAFPPGFSAANVVGGTDANAVFMTTILGATATINIERSFDGGLTWLMAGVGGTGTGATYGMPTSNPSNGPPAPISVVVGEPEQSVLYRLNCVSYASGTVNYRLSGTGAAASAWAFSSAI